MNIDPKGTACLLLPKKKCKQTVFIKRDEMAKNQQEKKRIKQSFGLLMYGEVILPRFSFSDFTSFRQWGECCMYSVYCTPCSCASE